MSSLDLSLRRLRAQLREIAWLRSAYYLMCSLSNALRDSSRRSVSELDAVFRDREDPWGYSRESERKRHDSEISMLDAVAGGGMFPRALEIGCAEGVFTERMAARCSNLLAVDISDIALQRAQSRCAGCANVRFEARDARDWPVGQEGTYDLIVAIHVLEYVRAPSAMRRIRRDLIASVRIGGYLLLGNVIQNSVNEGSWWSRLVLQSGTAINDYYSQHSQLVVVATSESALGDCLSRDVLLRRVA